MSILNKYKRWNPNLILLTDEIWDFVLLKNEISTSNKKNLFEESNIISYIDLSNPLCFNDDNIKSLPQYTWESGINNGVILKNIGLTGIDNGLITYNKGLINNQTFLDILTNTHLPIDQSKTLILKAVSGNSGIYDYSISKNNDFISLNGGFLQGFYKLNGCDYQVLPHTIKNEWGLGFVIRPQEYEETSRTLNCINPNNKGIFFYIGTRSENKFIKQYGYDLSEYRVRGIESDEEMICDKVYEGYFNDEYVENDMCPFDKEYFQEEIDILNSHIKTNDDVFVDIENYKEIETDNKFLIFNNSKNGFTTETWSDNDKFILTGSSVNNKENLFLLLNNTKTGYTSDTIDDYYNNKIKGYPNIKQDITENAFALRVREDGSVGYRYLVSDCNNENRFSIIEEYSKSDIVKKEEWNDINVRITRLGSNKMKIYIYINSLLKFISKDLPIFNFRPLNEHKDKQEGVPFNISIGGGTQGLCDSIWLDYLRTFKYVLPIEENFAGSFIGDIKSFKFFES